MIRTKACIWCGGTKMSGEDVIPRWIGRTLKKMVPSGEQLWLSVDHKMPQVETSTHKYHRKIGAASGPARHVVCDTCNRGWMKALEDAVKPVIENMILGKVPEAGLTLSDSDIDIICRWVTKTSLINYFVNEAPDCDPSVYHDFYRSPKASPNSRIWLMSHFPDSRELMKLWPTPLGRHRSNGGPRFILFTAYIGWFAFQFVIDVQIESLTLPGGRNLPDPVCFEIWPIIERRTWPPDKAMKLDAMEYFAENKVGPPPT